MSSFIAEDFTAIRARMQAIRAEERPAVAGAGTPAATERPATQAETRPADFYSWLLGGQLWG